MLPSAEGPCSFVSLAVEAREAVPARWLQTYGFALVRRGLLVRQRSDAQGRLTAVDVVGPGAGFSVPSAARDPKCSVVPAGYAATRALLCLVRGQAMCDHAAVGGVTATDLLELQGEAAERLERFADARSKPGLDARLAALLCCLADTLARDCFPSTAVDPEALEIVGRSRAAANLVPPGLLQRDLAALVSARHESVCRVLKSMSRRKLIQSSEAGIRLLDRAALEQL